MILGAQAFFGPVLILISCYNCHIQLRRVAGSLSIPATCWSATYWVFLCWQASCLARPAHQRQLLDGLRRRKGCLNIVLTHRLCICVLLIIALKAHIKCNKPPQVKEVDGLISHTACQQTDHLWKVVKSQSTGKRITDLYFEFWFPLAVDRYGSNLYYTPSSTTFTMAPPLQSLLYPLPSTFSRYGYLAFQTVLILNAAGCDAPRPVLCLPAPDNAEDWDPNPHLSCKAPHHGLGESCGRLPGTFLRGGMEPRSAPPTTTQQSWLTAGFRSENSVPDQVERHGLTRKGLRRSGNSQHHNSLSPSSYCHAFFLGL